MRRALPIALLLTTALTGCDVVKFPGITKSDPAPERRAPPPPPPLEPVNPISINGEIIDVPGQGSTLSASRTLSAELNPSSFAPATLASLNTKHCADQTSTGTNTLAEIMGAEETEPAVQPQAVSQETASLLDSFPGIAKLEPKRQTEDGRTASGHCGATRISNSWFVTAAHCVDQNYDSIDLIVGSSDLNSPFAQRIEADAALCHGGYTGQTGNYANDIALIHVTEAAANALAETPIAELDQTERPLTPLSYPIAHMAGWGVTNYDADLSSTLQTAELTLDGSGPAAIIVSSLDEAGPCIGDSGGPLFVTEEDGSRSLVGVLSVIEENTNGEFCSGDYKARYTNTSGFVDWANAVIAYCSTNFAACTNR